MPTNIEILYFIIALWALALGVGFLLSASWFLQFSKKCINWYLASKLFFLWGARAFKSFNDQCERIDKTTKEKPNLTSPMLDAQIAVLEKLNRTLDAINMANSVNAMKIHGITKMELVSIISERLPKMEPYERHKIIAATDCFADGDKLHFICDDKRTIH